MGPFFLFDFLREKNTLQNGSPSCAVLSLLQKQALPQVSVLPWCPRPQDQDLRFGQEEGRRRRVPSVRPSRLRRIGTALRRGFGGRPYLLQQVHGQEHGQGSVPHPYSRSPLPRSPHQQNVVVRRSR